jgi:5-(carboxyamino)imidazole ribonucleotide synthase
MTDLVYENLTLGILGGGQLARMLSIAAANLGIKTHIFCPEDDSPAFDVCASHILADYSDKTALQAFASKVDVVTFEFENVPTATIEHLQKQHIYPNARALATTQDRVVEKNFIASVGLKPAPFAVIDSLSDLEKALACIGTPSILKTRRMGYDGKGQAKILSAFEAAFAWQAIGEQAAVLEGFVSFSREISIIAARSRSGEVATYDVCENEHRNHILSRTTLPANITAKTAELARDAAIKIANALEYVGVLAVEMFVCGKGADEHLIINEIAPRVHNSGHWTIEGAKISQFEQHVRAVMGLPLGATETLGTIEMQNLLGEDMHLAPSFLALKDAYVHLYGKKQARNGRKMGHVTFVR